MSHWHVQAHPCSAVVFANLQLTWNSNAIFMSFVLHCVLKWRHLSCVVVGSCTQLSLDLGTIEHAHMSLWELMQAVWSFKHSTLHPFRWLCRLHIERQLTKLLCWFECQRNQCWRFVIPTGLCFGKNPCIHILLRYSFEHEYVCNKIVKLECHSLPPEWLFTNCETWCTILHSPLQHTRILYSTLLYTTTYYIKHNTTVHSSVTYTQIDTKKPLHDLAVWCTGTCSWDLATQWKQQQQQSSLLHVIHTRLQRSCILLLNAACHTYKA